ncbi:MAG TPA: hypothetical protein VGC54_09215 [Planctomycetota bacterium]
MPKPLRYSLLVGAGIPLLAVILVNLVAEPVEELPPLDPALAVRIGANVSVPLGELLEELLPAAARTATAPRDAGDEPQRWSEMFTSGPPTLIRMARRAMSADDYEGAFALLRAIPAGDSDWARAQRYIGWKIYGEHLGRPRAGIAYVNRALAKEPFEGNSWQDLSRAYLASVGI